MKALQPSDQSVSEWTIGAIANRLGVAAERLGVSPFLLFFLEEPVLAGFYPLTSWDLFYEYGHLATPMEDWWVAKP